MKQNYYEILEVDKNASPEIIKKAYNTLTKKYHPDLQNDDVKHLYEEKLKLINEAYETLSDEEKRKNYNLIITSENSLLENQLKTLYTENQHLKNQIVQLQSIIQNSTTYSLPYNNSSHFQTNANTYRYNNNNKSPVNTSRKQSNSFLKNFIKNIFSFIISCMFFYIMIRAIFAFSLFMS